ncbi:PstS5 [Desulforapulum autotrophicum HRM2]|uniref:Phosphate-binding protein n=1 Tax=Desulforapulum autotrophicum (strain ATCC 43914 / DSM 3382 / VKM B-1955 / HRM2) TaxID=177437 RepID=C0QJC5_DESAH|nr:phosphate ABC transporter substrate-binding protein [Desulforapulum autotrophicum]ACN15938.1 PstS5 [Desulforapulum autotrophicum HRM2]
MIKKIMVKGFVVVMVTFFMVLAGGVPGNASDLDRFKGLSGELRIAGGTAHIPVIKEAAKQIMTLNPDIRITIAGGGSGVGIKQVGEGLIDIGNSGRKPTDKEISTYGLTLYRWAIDGVAVVVNPKNRVTSLTKQQLIDIFSGKTTNWKEIGGNDGQINLYTRDEASGTRAVFWKKAINKGDIALSANFVVSNGAMKTAVGNDPNAIGYMSAGFVDDSLTAVTLDGVKPDTETIRSGEYTIARGLYSNTRGDATGLSQQFIEYLLSNEGQSIVREKGFIPVN